MRRLFEIGGALALLTGAGAASAQPAPLTALLEEARREIGAPGMAAAVWRDGRMVAEIAAGERALGSGVPVLPSDPFHIGSIAKPFTATLAARLVERGMLSWTDTVEARLGALIDVGEPYRRVTLADLLSHRGGLSPSPHPDEGAQLARARSLAEQHLVVAELMLSRPPAGVPRRDYLYSNFSYVAAAAMIEQATGRDYEELLRAEVLEPLGLVSAGFGAPGAGVGVDAPRGHFSVGHSVGPPIPPNSPLSDNLPYLRPAGGLHMTMADLARFGADQLVGGGGRGAVLASESYRFLQRPLPGGYAAGWAGRSGGEIYHDGSNRRWFALLRVIPSERLVIALAANMAGDEERTRSAFWRLSENLRRELR
jgi:CubicO group peptidase (beta-lactamase class C family)